MTAIVVHCANCGGKSIHLQVGTMDNSSSLSTAGIFVSVQLLHLHIQPSYKRSFIEQCAVPTPIKSLLNEINSLPATSLQKKNPLGKEKRNKPQE